MFVMSMFGLRLFITTIFFCFKKPQKNQLVLLSNENTALHTSNEPSVPSTLFT